MMRFCYTTAFSGLMALSLARADDGHLTRLVGGNREFACALYQQVAGKGENVFLSPHSISVALAMTYAGARGDTGLQMAQVLRFPLEPSDVHPAFGALDDKLAALQGPGVEWTVANSLWPHQRHPFDRAYVDLVTTFYRSEVIPVDFTESDPVRTRINQWVEEKTREKIKDLIPPGVLNSLTRMVLVNAVYFKGKWSNPFKETSTADRPFYPAEGITNLVPTMYSSTSAMYGEVDDGQILELSYEGGQIAMMMFLPGPGKSLADVEASLTDQVISRWEDALSHEEVEVYLPRFTMTSEFSLSGTLRTMGMLNAFDETKADFSGMDGLTNHLYISEVVHKAFVEVNEEGTEAAAATGVIMATRAMLPREKPVFRADHPFLFMIKDRSTGSILFMGRLANPAG